MQYIKNYNLELYNKIIALKESNKRTIIQKIIDKIKRYTEKSIVFPQKEVDEFINIACEYMNINKDEYYKIIEQFRAGELKLIENYENQNQTDIFWFNVDKKFICVNIYAQSNFYKSIYVVLSRLLTNNITVLDYGCGTGLLAILLHKRFNFKKLVLLDIDNYTAGFVKFYIEKTSSKEIVWEDILKYSSNETFDFVQSLDVLEHLENSYEHLLKLDGIVRKGGLMALKIAFEAEDKTHLPQAAESFFVKNDGLDYLKQKYNMIKRFGYEQLVNCVYKKRG